MIFGLINKYFIIINYKMFNLFHLPTELINYIYTFDDTNLKNYNKCLKIIQNLPQIVTIKTRKKYCLENIFGEVEHDFVYKNNNFYTSHFFLVKFDIRKKYEVVELYSYVRNIYNFDKKYYSWLFQILPSLEKVLEN